MLTFKKANFICCYINKFLFLSFQGVLKLKPKLYVCSILCLLLIFLSFNPVKAGLAPLERQGKIVNPTVSDDISLTTVTTKIYPDIESTGFDSLYILKNNDLQKRVTLIAGYPSDNGKISNFSVSIDGQFQKIIYRKPSPDHDDYIGWFTWNLTFEPGETKMIKISFLRQNNPYDPFSNQILYVLKPSSGWEGTIGKIKIEAIFDKYQPYIFNPDPSPAPTAIQKDGTLEWTMKDVQPQQNIEIFFQPTDVLTVNYLNEKSKTSDKMLSEIANSYKNNNYLKSIRLCEDYLNQGTQPEFKNEVNYFLAKGYHYLLEYDKALDVYNQIKGTELFEDLSTTINNEILYNISTLYEHTAKADDYQAFIDSITESKSSKPNLVFDDWLETQRPITEKAKNQEQDSDTEQVENQTNKKQDKQEETFSSGTVLFSGFILGFFIARLIYKPKKRRRSYYY